MSSFVVFSVNDIFKGALLVRILPISLAGLHAFCGEIEIIMMQDPSEVLRFPRKFSEAAAC